MSTELEIRITAEMRQIKAALAGLQSDIARVGTSANRSAAGGRQLAGAMQQSSIATRGAANEARGLQGAMAGAVTQAKLFLAGVGVVGFVGILAKAADTTTRLNGQLRSVTKTQQEFTAAQEGTFAVAQRTRQGLEATVNLYQRIARAGKTSQVQTLALTETIGQAVALSFTSADAAQAALFQLGQGLGSGTLRGEELNSVLEQTPRLAEAIATGLVKLGKIKDPGDLRAFAQKNGIEAKLVVDAIQTQQERLREEFGKLQPTIAEAVTGLKNEFLKLVGEQNDATGAAATLAGTIKLLADNLGTLANVLILGAKLLGIYFLAFRAAPAVIGALGVALTFVRNQSALATVGMRAFAAQVTAAGFASSGSAVKVGLLATQLKAAAILGPITAKGLVGAAAVIGAAFAGLAIGNYLRKEFLIVERTGIAMAVAVHSIAFQIGHAFKTAAAVTLAAFTGAFAGISRKAAGALRDIANLYRTIPGGLGAAQAAVADAGAAAIDKAVKNGETVSQVMARMSFEGRLGLAQIANGYRDLDAAAVKARGATDAALGTTGGSGGKGSGEAKKAVKGVVDELALMKDAAERALVALDQLYEDAGISTRAYFAEKLRLQQESIDVDIAIQKREAARATTSEARGAALTQIIVLERQRRDVAIAAVRDQAKAEDELIDKLGSVKARLLALGGETGRARAIELEAEFAELLKRLGENADTAGKDLVRKLINLEAARAQLDQFGTQFRDVTGQLGQLQQTTSAQISAGLLSNSTGEKRLNEARTESIEKLTVLRAKVQELYAAMGDPAALLQLQAIDAELAQLSISTDDWRGKIIDAGEGALGTFFTDIATGAKTAGEAFRDLAINFTKSLAQMAAQALAKKAIAALTDLFTKRGEGAGGGATKIATEGAAGAAYAAPVATAAVAMAGAGGALVSGGAAVASAAVALQAAATTLLIANSASIAHSGGVIGELGGSRQVSPLLFMGAPRYHTGGIAGVGRNEVPAILERGEEVLTKTDARHRKNGGLNAVKGGNAGVRLVVVDDQRSVGKYLESADGERVIVKAMQRNQLSTRS